MRREIRSQIRRLTAFLLGVMICFYLVPVFTRVVYADELLEPLDEDYRYVFDFTNYREEQGNRVMYFGAHPRDENGDEIYVHGKWPDIITIVCPNKAFNDYGINIDETVENVGSVDCYIYSEVKAYGGSDGVMNAYPGDSTYDRVVAYCLEAQEKGISGRPNDRKGIDESYGDRRKIAWRDYRKQEHDAGKTGKRDHSGPSLRWEEEGNMLLPITELGLSENFDAVIKISYKIYCDVYSRSIDGDAAAADAYARKNIAECEQKIDEYMNMLLYYDFDPQIERECIDISGEEAGEKQHKTDVTTAVKAIGEEETTSIPPWVFIPPIIVVPPVIIHLINNKKKKKKQGEQSSKQEDTKKQEEPQCTYDMGVNKDFGDTIIAGEKPGLVGARIIEYKPGEAPKTHREFTRMIRPSSDGYLIVEDDGTPGEYHQAWVSAPKSADAPSTAAVNFTFNYLGGSYTRQIVFKIAGDPEIEFVEWNKMGIYFVKDMIWGDGEVYFVKIRLKNFSQDEEPSFQFGGGHEEEGIKLSAYKVNGADPEIYEIKIINDSEARQPGKLDDKQNEQIYVSVKASNSKQSAEETFVLRLFQFGLAVTSENMNEKGKILVDTHPLDLECTKFKAVGMKFSLCIPDREQGAILVDPDKYTVKFEPKIEGELTEKEKNALDKFEFAMNDRARASGLYGIEPHSMLPHPKGENPYSGIQIATAEYQGISYKAYIHYVFEGLASSSMQEIDQEIENIRKIVSTLGISGNARALLRQDLSQMSKHELCLIRKAIYDDFVAFEESYAKEYEAYASTLDILIDRLELTKWIGDQAFSYLVQYYAAIHVGPEWASTVEAVVTPWKDTIIGWIIEGMAGEHWYDGLTMDSLVNAALSNAENMLMNVLGDAAGDAFVTKKIGGKEFAGKCAAIVSMYLAANFAKHYCTGGEEKGKIYDSIIATTGDLSANALKTFISTLISKAMHTDAKNLEKRLTNTLEKVCESNVRIDYISELLTKKYGKELGAVNATEKLTKNFTETTMQTIADVVEKTGALNEFEDLVFKYASEIYGDKISEYGKEWMEKQLNTMPGQFFTDIVTFIVKNIERTGTEIVSILWNYVLNMGQFMLPPVPLPGNPEPIKK